MPSPPHPDLGDQNPLAVGLGLAGRQPVRLHRRSCRGRPLGTRDLAHEARSGLACCPPSTNSPLRIGRTSPCRRSATQPDSTLGSASALSAAPKRLMLS